MSVTLCIVSLALIAAIDAIDCVSAGWAESEIRPFAGWLILAAVFALWCVAVVVEWFRK